MHCLLTSVRSFGKGLGAPGILSQSFYAMGPGVMRSTIKHSWAGTGCFAREQFGKLIMIGY